MDPQHDHSAGPSVWALARTQHGVVSRSQLLDLGLSNWGIRHRVSCGRLFRVGEGVYAVGRPGLDRGGRWMAALLSCGRSAVLSHWSAAALWGIGTEKQMIEVSVRTCMKVRRHGVRVHRRAGLREEELASRGGIPVTSPVSHDGRPGGAGWPGSNRANGQRSRQARPGRSAEPAHRSRRLSRPARRGAVARCGRPAILQTHRLRARAAVPAVGSRRGASCTADPAAAERISGRFLLAGTRPGGRDRWLSLPPNAR